MGFAGMDRSEFPGSEKMKELKQRTNLAWTGFYLGPAPLHLDTGWMDRRAELLADGWGFAPVYVGLQDGNSHLPTHGTAHGESTSDLMEAADFPAGSVVYIDLEKGDQPSEPLKKYLTDWATRVMERGFTPGIYCSHVIAPAIIAALPQAVIWAFRVPAHPASPVNTPFQSPDTSGSGVPTAKIWQRVQNVDLSISGNIILKTVDLNTATTADPSKP